MLNGRVTSDFDLLSQVQVDDQQALLALMKKYDRGLFRYIYSKTNSIESAEEAVQDIFISLWNNRHTLIITDTLSPYLYKAAKNKALDFYIANTKSIVHPEALLPDYAHAAPSPENAVIESELSNWLSAEIDKMPENIRNVFQLSRMEQLPVKEIASKLSLSEQTVKNNLSIAVKRLHFRFKRMENIYLCLAAARMFLYFQ